MTKTPAKPALKRELGLLEVTFYGVGIILGAGVYALLGKGAGLSGNALWLSFTIAAIIAAFTGMSYAELSSMYPKTAAEYNYTMHAFKKKTLSIIIGLLLAALGAIGAATVSLGFAGYFTGIFGGSYILTACTLIIMLSIINYIGIKESSRYNIIATVIEASGLILVIMIWLFFFRDSGVDLLETAPQGFQGVTPCRRNALRGACSV